MTWNKAIHIVQTY